MENKSTNGVKKSLQGPVQDTKLGRRIFIKRTDLDNALNEVKSFKYKR